MSFSFTSLSSGAQGPKGDPGPATDTYDKIYVTNNGNGTNVKVGDDAWIGDVNIANHISIKGFEDQTKAGIVLGSNKTEKISTDASNLSVHADNDVILYPGSTYAYIDTPEISGGNRIATWDYVVTQSPAALQYGSFYDVQQQTGTANSIQPMMVRSTQFSSGVSVTSNSHININHAGRYNLAFSAQFHQTSSSGVVNVWLAKNGTAVDNTNTKISIPSNAPYQVAAWNFFVDSEGSDYYQIMWSSDSANTVIETVGATGSGASLYPAVPSVILTVNQVGI
jgi:hypothetical protein